MKMSEFKKKYLAKKNYQHLKLTLIISSLFAEIFRSLPLFEVEIIAFCKILPNIPSLLFFQAKCVMSGRVLLVGHGTERKRMEF